MAVLFSFFPDKLSLLFWAGALVCAAVCGIRFNNMLDGTCYPLQLWLFWTLGFLFFLAGAILPWRKIRFCIRYFLFLIFSMELVLQVLALFGLLPHLNIAHHTPYARIYNSEESHGNDMMNRYGWHYSEFRFRKDAQRVAIIGDSFVDALQNIQTGAYGNPAATAS